MGAPEASDDLSKVALKILNLYPEPVEVVDLNAMISRALLDAKEAAVLASAGVELNQCTLRNGRCRSVVLNTRSGGPIIITDLSHQTSRNVRIEEVGCYVREAVRSLAETKYWTVIVDATPDLLLVADEKRIGFSVENTCPPERVLRIAQFFAGAGCPPLDQGVTGGNRLVMLYGSPQGRDRVGLLFEAVVLAELNQGRLVSVSVS